HRQGPFFGGVGVAIKDPPRIAPGRVDGELIYLGWTWGGHTKAATGHGSITFLLLALLQKVMIT
ncbi:MAG: hypothetical protein NWS01_08360, partial [Burkholderiales bacterium]|nr:hypothetical protein [Burkholderiales bacterium]